MKVFKYFFKVILIFLILEDSFNKFSEDDFVVTKNCFENKEKFNSNKKKMIDDINVDTTAFQHLTKTNIRSQDNSKIVNGENSEENVFKQFVEVGCYAAIESSGQLSNEETQTIRINSKNTVLNNTNDSSFMNEQLKFTNNVIKSTLSTNINQQNETPKTKNEYDQYFLKHKDNKKKKRCNGIEFVCRFV